MPAQLFTAGTFSGTSDPNLQNAWTTPEELFVLSGYTC